MKVLFRADASNEIGTGHVMRCLTLADALESQGVECQFICRTPSGHISDHIKDRGFRVYDLGTESSSLTYGTVDALDHAHWLGVSQEYDVQQCKEIVTAFKPDLIVVDHYALDQEWEDCFGSTCKIVVIDDLADRSHVCDLLLDQTYGRMAVEYASLVPDKCISLCGSEFSLLRPEFAELRAASLLRRDAPVCRKILVNMGGVDNDNITCHVLKQLDLSPYVTDCEIVVVMGKSAPWLNQVTETAEAISLSTEVLVGVSNMAELMASADLAIGAAGSTAWERCCLGLPTIMLILAENQQLIAEHLEEAGGAMVLREGVVNLTDLLSVATQSGWLISASEKSASIVDGKGASRVVENILRLIRNG
jgi:UDP-2,4-diacetamido-2,4,6-trideoxy-beta-L-altropyranose hydrolase